MATTPKGIYYPNDYNEIADIPEDMKKMAESIEEVFEDTDSDLSDIKEEQTTQNNRLNSLEVDNTTNKSDILTNKQDINNIKTEQTTQNNRLNNLETDNTTNKSNISANTQEINNIKQEQTTQNTNISTNATNIESLQGENETLKSIVNQMPQVEGQGTEVTLEDTIEAPFTIFDVEGNSVQDGSPSPDNEVPIYSAGDNGSINEKIQTRNLWSSVWEQGYINANGVNENNSDLIRTKDYIYFEPEQKYAIKRSIATAYTNVRGYDKNKRFVGTGSNVIVLFSGSGADNPMQATIQTCVIATKPGVYYLRFNDASNNLSTEYMMVKGDTPEDYVPHEEQDYSIPVQQPMRSIGDIRDCFVKKDGNWFERHYIGRKILNGTELVECGNADGGTEGVSKRFYITHNLTNLIPANTPDKLMCSNFVIGSTYGNDNTLLQLSATLIYIRININEYSNLQNKEQVKAWLAEQYASENPVYVDYELATPLDLPCTQSQIDVLENKPSTYKDFTIIQSQDETEAYLEVSGIYDLNKLITRTEVLESES